MKTSASWDTMPCSPLKINRLVEGTCRLHLQDRRISRASNQREANRKQSKSLRISMLYSTALKALITTQSNGVCQRSDENIFISEQDDRGEWRKLHYEHFTIYTLHLIFFFHFGGLGFLVCPRSKLIMKLLIL
jgi:hypothetical protein